MAILNGRKIRSREELGNVLLRKLDRLECEASGYSVEEAITLALEKSTESFGVFMGKELFAVWGYQACADYTNMWLLTTYVVDRFPKMFIEECRRILKELLVEFPRITFSVWARHQPAIRLLYSLEFVPVAISGLPEEFFLMVKEG